MFLSSVLEFTDPNVSQSRFPFQKIAKTGILGAKGEESLRFFLFTCEVSGAQISG
jgi:hypothetical protein